MLPFKVPENFRIIAHRGASGYAPENTLSAFTLAFEMGANEFELDIQLSKDGEAAICHDNTLERYGHGAKKVKQLTWEELSTLDMGSWFSPHLFANVRMITLETLFEQFNDRVTYHVELKGCNPKLAEKTLEIIDEFELRENCIATSFSYDNLLSMNKICPDIRLGWLVEKIDAKTLKLAKEASLYQICPRASSLAPDSVKKAREIVPEVRAWGINGPRGEVIKLIRQCLDSECDGMTINWPDWLKKV